jgi:hypothetical protein
MSSKFPFIFNALDSNADVAKLADALDLGSENACHATANPKQILTILYARGALWMCLFR